MKTLNDDGFEEFEERELDKIDYASITDPHDDYAQCMRDVERMRNEILEAWEAKKRADSK